MWRRLVCAGGLRAANAHPAALKTWGMTACRCQPAHPTASSAKVWQSSFLMLLTCWMLTALAPFPGATSTCPRAAVMVALKLRPSTGLTSAPARKHAV